LNNKYSQNNNKAVHDNGNKVGIVILNYINYNDTIECVESAFDLKYSNYCIIIVENGSGNNSYEILHKKYKSDKDIIILKNNDNLGFARGNNTGIDYARSKLNCDFIFAVNNDTVFTDKNILSSMINKYKNNIGLIGPKIIGKDGKNQNPFDFGINFFKFFRDYLGSILYSFYDINAFQKTFIYKLLSKIIRKNIKKEVKKSNMKNIVLHGSAIMLTPYFFKFYNGFYPETFLYYEEYILTVLSGRKNIASVYDEDSMIFHKEDMSSIKSFGNDFKIKSKIRNKSILKCLKIKIFGYKT